MERRACGHFFLGVNQGLPIGLGYLSVSFTFGIMAVSMGLPWWAALLISMTNLTSAGQVAGIVIIAAGGGYAELALSQLVINLRYALMSLTLSQKLDASVTRGQRFLMAFGITDEIFALAASRDGWIGFGYFLGLLVLPYLGWASGTLLGASAGALLPSILTAVLGIAIYGMFLAIILPAARTQKSVALVILTAVIFSCMFHYIPLLSGISEGMSIILCAVAASALGAWLFPVHTADGEKEEGV